VSDQTDKEEIVRQATKEVVAQTTDTKQGLLYLVARTLVSIVGLVGITVLAYGGKVDPAATVAVYSTVLSLYGAAIYQQARKNG
jgi:hypothetical protein